MRKGKWSGSEVVYHIYPWSFMDSNGDGCGDLRGIIDRLDHLGGRSGLGVDAIWLSPIYPSPMVDFGYDVTDHKDIDPRFGDLRDFDDLVAGAHRRSLKVMLDLVANHTSDAHPWFLGSRSSRKDPKRNWYVWRDPAPDGGPPNNWLSVFGGSAWTLDRTTGQYYLHSFLKEQPDVNWRNAAAAKEMTGVLRFWLERGVDGFRIDAIYHLMKDPSFRNEPRNPEYRPGKDDPYKAYRHVYSQRRPETFALVRRLCRIAAQHDAFMVGESYLDVRGMRKFYEYGDPRRYAPLNFNLMSLPWDAREFRSFIAAYERSLSGTAVPNYVLGNHDRSRLASRMGPKRARVAATLLLTLRGMPYIYYGDELGMKDVDIAPGGERDPFGVIVPGLHLGRDPQRSPMQWDSGPHAGFSVVTPWLPTGKDAARSNVASESADPASFLTLYKTLLGHRRRWEALRSGSIHLVGSDRGVLAYERKAAGASIAVAANFLPAPRRVALGRWSSGTVLCDSGCRRKAGTKIDLRALELEADEAVVVLLER